MVVLFHHSYKDIGELLTQLAALGDNAVEAVELAGEDT